MSLEKCSSCGSEFLTEADPYIVRPTKDELKLYCSCYIVGHNQFDHVDKIKDLEAKNAELIRINELYTDKIFELEKKLETVVEALNFYADKSNYQGSPSRIDMQDNGEKAREVIKMLGNDEGDK